MVDSVVVDGGDSGLKGCLDPWFVKPSNPSKCSKRLEVSVCVKDDVGMSSVEKMRDRDMSYGSSIGFASFGGGLRLCPGLNLARLQASKFMHHFVIESRSEIEEYVLIRDSIFCISLLHGYQKYDLTAEWNMFGEMSKRKIDRDKSSKHALIILHDLEYIDIYNIFAPLCLDENLTSEPKPMFSFLCFIVGDAYINFFGSNNAGIMAPPFLLSKDNIELFATNHLGRIVNVSSKGHQFAYKGIYFDQLNNESSYNSIYAYGQSKLTNILHAKELT
ncbi:short-chain dehydrogenase TIC 32, chloroplastic [Tanacetum coccineum]